MGQKSQFVLSPVHKIQQHLSRGRQVLQYTAEVVDSKVQV